MTQTHEISIHCEGPTRSLGFFFSGGHRAQCSCGWWSDCYTMMSDTERAIDVHLRRARHEDFEKVLARSSIGKGLADIKARGIDAHLADLEREMSRRRRPKKPSKKPSASAVAIRKAVLR